MKKLITFVISLAFLVATIMPIHSVEAKTRVHGYYKKSGHYVQPHYRSDRDSRKSNNWSTKGNYNPYSGKKGYKTYRFGR